MPPLCPAPLELSKWKLAAVSVIPASRLPVQLIAVVPTNGRGTPVYVNPVSEADGVGFAVELDAKYRDVYLQM